VKGDEVRENCWPNKGIIIREKPQKEEDEENPKNFNGEIPKNQKMNLYS